MVDEMAIMSYIIIITMFESLELRKNIVASAIEVIDQEASSDNLEDGLTNSMKRESTEENGEMVKRQKV